MKKTFSTLVLMLLGITMSLAQTWTPTYPVNINATNFPDAVFRQWVLDNVDTNKDGLLNENEVNRCTSLSKNYIEMRSLKGIEYLKKLKTIKIFYSYLAEVDVSRNTELSNLQIYHAPLIHVNIGNNPNLTTCYIVNCAVFRELQVVGDNREDLGVNDVKNRYTNSGFRTTSVPNKSVTNLDVSEISLRTWKGTQYAIIHHEGTNDLAMTDAADPYLVRFGLPLWDRSGPYPSSILSYNFYVSDYNYCEIKVKPCYALYLHPATILNNDRGVYMGTMYLPHPVIVPEGVKAYVLSSLDQVVQNGVATLSLFGEAGDTLAAEQGYVITAENSGYYVFNIPHTIRETLDEGAILTYNVTGAKKPSRNFLRGTYNESGKTVKYGSVLTLGARTDDGSKKMGFWNYSGTKINPYRAYIPTDLVSSAAQNNTRFMGFELLWSDDAENDVTGINAAEQRSMLNGERSVVFDLQGRRVANPQKGGVYVVNGKKVMM